MYECAQIRNVKNKDTLISRGIRNIYCNPL